MLSSEAPIGTLVASAARTADNYSEEMLNDGKYRGLLLTFNVTVNAGAAASVTPTMQYKDPVSGAWITYQAFTAIAAVACTHALIYPMGLAAASWDIKPWTQEFAGPLPLLWRLFMDHADANPATYSVGFQYLP